MATMGSVEAELRRKVRIQDARTVLVESIAAGCGFSRTQIQSGFPFVMPHPAPSEFASRVG
jgi:hypothetical protein